MKTIFKLLSLASLTALALAPLARADEPPATPPAEPPAGDHPHPGRGMRGDRLKMLAEKLQLTDDQKAQVKTILNGDETQMKALRDDDALSEEDRRAKFMALRKSTHDQIRALLTPDQQKTFDSLPEPRGHRGPPKGDGAAPADAPPPKQ